MGQAYPTERCEQRGTLKVLGLPAQGNKVRARFAAWHATSSTR